MAVPQLDDSEFSGGPLRLLDDPADVVLAGHHWMNRRYAATREIRDDDHVAEIPAVRAGLAREQVYRRTLACSDALTALATTIIAALAWGAPISWTLALVPLIAVVVGKVQGLYDRDGMVLGKSTLGEWRTVLQANSMVAISVYLLWWASSASGQDHGIRIFALLTLLMFTLSLPARAAARRIARAVTEDERCLIVGAAEASGALAALIASTPGAQMVGAICDDDVDCSVAGVHELVEQLDAQRIVIVPHPGWGEPGVLKLVQSCKWLGVRVSIMPTVMNVVGASAQVDAMGATVLLGVPRFGLSRSSLALKRAFDVAIASLLLTLTAPLLLAIGIAIRVDGEGQVLFRQKRIGRDGEPFSMLKFRSMVRDAELMKAGLQSENDASGLFKLDDDPRVTRVGRILRRTYLDELPQLVNVIRGDMSLVGPRPLIAAEDILLEGYDRHRSRLTPGMTGPWQLRGPIDAPLTELAKLDYLYASNWSVWADIDILLGTITRVLNRGGR